MAKKTDDAEVKKECPSCGLGVALDATICEFCGWDFDEEDEWILQIEKLERDLMLEKQKFEPGTVDQRIESTLHTPAFDRIEMIKSTQKSAKASAGGPQQDESARTSSQVTAQRGIRGAMPQEIAPARPNPEPEASLSRAGTPGASSTPTGTRARRVRTAKAPATAEEPPTGQDNAEASGPVKRTRVVRKVKQ